MINKIRNQLDLLTRRLSKYFELRYAGQAIFVVIILLISWSGIGAIQSNYKLQEQVNQINQQNNLSNLQNENINLQNQYYQSKQYLELSARENLGLALPGETELLVPSNVALSYTVPQPSGQPTGVSATQPKSQQDFTAWVDFFLHRNDFSSS
jgi:hypothetical protein